MYDQPSIGNFGYSYEYEAPQVIGILSREVFKLHKLLEYINDDRDNIFLGTIWQELNRSAGTELIPSTRIPPDDGIPQTWLILTLMVISMVQQKLTCIMSSGIPIWWWDPRIYLSGGLIQRMVDRVVKMIDLLYF